jgi:hypothetical protein
MGLTLPSLKREWKSHHSCDEVTSNRKSFFVEYWTLKKVFSKRQEDNQLKYLRFHHNSKIETSHMLSPIRLRWYQTLSICKMLWFVQKGRANAHNSESMSWLQVSVDHICGAGKWQSQHMISFLNHAHEQSWNCSWFLNKKSMIKIILPVMNIIKSAKINGSGLL